MQGFWFVRLVSGYRIEAIPLCKPAAAAAWKHGLFRIPATQSQSAILIPFRLKHVTL
jgi:hypothetical protein